MEVSIDVNALELELLAFVDMVTEKLIECPSVEVGGVVDVGDVVEMKVDSAVADLKVEEEGPAFVAVL